MKLSKIFDSDDLTYLHKRRRKYRAWWKIVFLSILLIYLACVLLDERYKDSFLLLVLGRPAAAATEGLLLTIRISVSAFSLALLIGLMIALMRVSTKSFLTNISILYVEIFRGIPTIVMILYIAFVFFPLVVITTNMIGDLFQIIMLKEMTLRQISFEVRAITALALVGGAYEAEIFRAGIQSIDKEQLEAAMTSGASYRQAIWSIALPQAVRIMLPPIGNDFISMIKDSALVTVLAIPEITHLGRIQRAATFSAFEVFNSMAVLYLCITVGLSQVIRLIEKRYEK